VEGSGPATAGEDELGPDGWAHLHAWDDSPLPPNVHVGEDTVFERTRHTLADFRSTRAPGLMLGDGVRVHHGTAFGVEAGGTVEVGDGSILAGVVFMCAERITLGSCVVASYNVTIADCDFHPLDPDLRRRDAVANAPEGDRSDRPPLVTAPVVVEDGAWIGIGAIVLKGVRIGSGARIGAGAVVNADVPRGATLAGNPGRLLSPGEFE
jgi:acetyltransferase-like isoleucine patch superfamily enzyme